ncbi:amidase [Sabulicella glaciei]|uniref:Amidase n=1 Tax=Sabulicella glaciei TaxID=2984948 RepID=A0ABT3P202_9PROT|nr:amidase [Roseococcus sp. MDT2-1-1]MCW8088442.1 amidase [Roseococcus sp. MDT2-1-1]
MPDAIPTDPRFLGIAQASRLIATRRLSPVELTRALIGRAEALDGQISSYLRPSFDTALKEAQAAEQEIASGGPRGPLHGVPFGLKDIFDVAGVPTTGQSRAYASQMAREDSEVVRRLRGAGAVLLGKLTTHECAHGGPSFDLFAPPARNPWDTSRFTGGSSSGSGAAVAAGLMPLALGSDTGGSIRNPAALCGLVGLKPTYGLVSRRGVMPNAFGWDHVGPMTWTVEDCALALQVLAGHDPGDPASAQVVPPDYRAALTGDLRGLRIGVLRHFFEEDLPASPAMAAALEQAFAVLRSLGADLRDVRIRPSRDYAECKIIAAESEILAVHEHALRRQADRFGEDFLTRILPAILIRGADYVQANRLRAIMTREIEALQREVDVLVTAAPGPAPLLSDWRPANFWRGHGSHVPVFNVTGAPALVQCIGFADGLPLSFQVAGRPFEEATVLRVAHAYEKATGGRERRPSLDPLAVVPPLPPVPEPEAAALSAAEEGELRDLLRRARVDPGERGFRHLCSVAPHVREALARLHRPAAFANEPAAVFRA